MLTRLKEAVWVLLFGRTTTETRIQRLENQSLERQALLEDIITKMNASFARMAKAEARKLAQNLSGQPEQGAPVKQSRYRNAHLVDRARAKGAIAPAQGTLALVAQTEPEGGHDVDSD